jgi:hypothetical protein
MVVELAEPSRDIVAGVAYIVDGPENQPGFVAPLQGRLLFSLIVAGLG